MNIISGVTTVSTAGTAVRINNTKHVVIRMYVHVLDSNSGPVYLGDSDVSGTGTLSGLEIHESASSRDESPLEINFTGAGGHGGLLFEDLWLDAENNGDKLSWLAVTK